MVINRKKYAILLIPAVLILILIYALPMLNTLRLSFYGFYGGEFVGLRNYRALFNILGPLTRKTFIWTFGSVIPAMIIGLGGALLFQESFRGKQVWVVLGASPYCMPLVIVATLWNIMLDPMYGLINTLLLQIGAIEEPIVFLSTKYAMVSVIIARIWRAVPFAFIAYYAGLKSIPRQLYEAAQIDGANSLQQFIHITLPQLRPVSLTSGLVLMIWTMLVFDIIYTMTGGGPARATRILPIEIYQQFMVIGNKGVASALAIVTIIILLLLSFVYYSLLEGGETE